MEDLFALYVESNIRKLNATGRAIAERCEELQMSLRQENWGEREGDCVELGEMMVLLATIATMKQLKRKKPSIAMKVHAEGCPLADL
jgi:hypothetical protein